MCVGIIFNAHVEENSIQSFSDKVRALCDSYQYGICMGAANLHPDASPVVTDLFPGKQVSFQIHDIPELYCACDIDQDIRNGSRNGKPSKFFDFVKELKDSPGVTSFSILFYQDDAPKKETIREKYGSFEEFVNLLNTWNTWQVEGFEPTRQAYFVADASPLLYTFNDKRLPN